MTLTQIATYYGPIRGKFGTPRQSGLAKAVEGRVEFLDKYGVEEALRGLEGFGRIWLIWGFSLNRAPEQNVNPDGSSVWSPTVRPPRLGGNRSVGVWASRSPYRPNPVGLSCVEIVRIGKGEIIVRGADLVDGTPVFDIKPYIPYADSFPDAKPGFAAAAPEAKLEVQFPGAFPIDGEQRQALRQILALDPRPAYQDEPGRTYGMSFGGYEVHFRINGDTLTVIDAVPGTGIADESASQENE